MVARDLRPNLVLPTPEATGGRVSTRITVYTAPMCGYCGAAKRLLDKKGIAYESIDLGGNPAARAKLVEETGWRTVPITRLQRAPSPAGGSSPRPGRPW